MTSWITETTGVKLNITYAASSDYTELYTMIAAGLDLPDMLYLDKWEPMLAEEEFILPLNQIADEYGYQAFYDNLPFEYDVLHTMEDGNIYYYAGGYGDSKALAALPYGEKGVTGWNIKYPMWERMGYPSVDTLDDCVAVARLAKQNGVDYPIFLVTDGAIGDMTYAQVMNVSYGGPGFVYPQADGIVTFNIKSDEYKQGQPVRSRSGYCPIRGIRGRTLQYRLFAQRGGNTNQHRGLPA